MSRAARNRLARNHRDSRPSGQIGVHTPARPALPECPHDSSRIRVVGYLGRNQTSVRYSGSGEQGYYSAWTGSMDFYTDPRWSATVSSQQA